MHAGHSMLSKAAGALTDSAARDDVDTFIRSVPRAAAWIRERCDRFDLSVSNRCRSSTPAACGRRELEHDVALADPGRSAGLPRDTGYQHAVGRGGP